MSLNTDPDGNMTNPALFKPSQSNNITPAVELGLLVSTSLSFVNTGDLLPERATIIVSVDEALYLPLSR